MENLTIPFVAVIISFLLILITMKFLKFIYTKIIYKVIIFFKPELKNIYDFAIWLKSLFKKK